MVLQRAKGVIHASLLHSVEVIQERVRVIDPTLVDVGESYPHSLDVFMRGWEETQNEAIILHPSNIRLPINMRKKIKQESIDNYTEE